MVATRAKADKRRRDIYPVYLPEFINGKQHGEDFPLCREEEEGREGDNMSGDLLCAIDADAGSKSGVDFASEP